jgi:hypothetical protein
MATIEQRLKALESKETKPSDIVIKIILGIDEIPTEEEQAQIDEVERQGGLVIIWQVV